MVGSHLRVSRFRRAGRFRRSRDSSHLLISTFNRQPRTCLLAAAVAVAAAVTAACAHPGALTRPVPEPFVRTVTLYGHPLELHLATLGSGNEPLLVFATGDGGWRGYDLDTFRHLVSWGYPVAGFSAPEYIKYLRGEDETTTPVRLATDYMLIVELAKRELRLPTDTPVILVGISRGAGLAVVAAGQRLLQPELARLL